jgi:DNA-binding CsgD family transcriptional regulator
MTATGLTRLAEGEAALARGDWATARSVFADALAGEDTPDACYGLARATEWAGDFATAIRMYERAFAGLRARGETRLPALIAGRELAFLHAAVYGNMAAAGGWLARARTLADDAGDCPERGWVELAEAMTTDDPDAVEAHARTATAIARRFGDADLHFCALGYSGTGLVLRGRVAEGMRRVDEAAVAATSGEVRDHLVVGEIYCKILLCCELALDVRRAQDWMAVADAAGQASNDLWVSAICRMHYGGVLIAAGQWAEAEDTLASSLRLYDTGMRALRSGAAVRLADLRVRQGRLDETAALLAGSEFDSYAALPLARLHVGRGENEVAVAVLRRSVGRSGCSVGCAPAWGLLGELHAAAGRAADAQLAVDGLAALASATGLPHVRGHAELVAGLARWSQGDDGALQHLESALAAFAQAGLPWELARTRLSMARMLAGADRQVAVADARAALRTFRELGAARDADSAAAFLRALGVGDSRPRDPGMLTAREHEVLRLLVEGLSNQEIAGRLFLSKRTVEHHVGSILAKLGASSRAEAQAHALRSGIVRLAGFQVGE